MTPSPRPHRDGNGWPSEQGPPDAGFTLVEMGVAMLIMAIFLVLIVQSMVHLVNPTLQTEAIRDSSNQLDIAFLDLDGEVRYA
ncbi:MAG TPA: type II secretion system protein, partial [Acidimicrobiales bacterium]|nr:type II secretion system protein [Acidimicrobiales bacterium]